MNLVGGAGGGQNSAHNTINCFNFVLKNNVNVYTLLKMQISNRFTYAHADPPLQGGKLDSVCYLGILFPLGEAEGRRCTDENWLWVCQQCLGSAGGIWTFRLLPCSCHCGSGSSNKFPKIP